MNNEITFDGQTMRGASTAAVALATTKPAAAVAGVVAVAKLVKKIVGASPT